MAEHVAYGKLRIHPALDRVVKDEIAPGTSFGARAVWALLESLVFELGPKNDALLAKRVSLQKQIDDWFQTQTTTPAPAEIKAFLHQIGYLTPDGDDFQITTTNVDDEIATMAGPQLVVPIDNARYALNAANARWGSLFDAFYGTDLIPETDGSERGQSYNPKRGALVIAKANALMDEVLPLAAGRWEDIHNFQVVDAQLQCALSDETTTLLKDPTCFAGFVPEGDHFSHLLFKHHNLHLDVLVDPTHPIGKQHRAGVKDILMESAISTIMDCEDSVAAVDADDKATVYANWAAIMKGTLAVTFDKGDASLTRTLNPDLECQDPQGRPLRLPGRSLMLIRHVGAHIYTQAVTTDQGKAIPETFIDAVVTVLGALHDLAKDAGDTRRNSRTASIYIVKPKQHGAEEVALSVALFERVEQAYGLPKNTLKIGIMDEEKRTTLNLKACIRAAAERVIFINTGFLDRTADEIHTCMEAGAMLPKLAIKSEPWIVAYEDCNVDVGLACGFHRRAQIGKGMWPEPDAMQAMMDTKIAHPAAGANCAWVPSPTAATLHAIHYHQVDVMARQRQRLKQPPKHRLDDLLRIPLLGDLKLADTAIQEELDNNVQGILGYVVRWVEQGVGCSKVPDIHDVGLMEDRATLRISSQHIANWLHHGIVHSQQVTETMQRVAAIVDRQNAGDAHYHPMAPEFEASIAFQAACDLIFGGRDEANGYTEDCLIRHRLNFKSKHASGT